MVVQIFLDIFRLLPSALTSSVLHSTAKRCASGTKYKMQAWALSTSSTSAVLLYTVAGDDKSDGQLPTPIHTRVQHDICPLTACKAQSRKRGGEDTRTLQVDDRTTNASSARMKHADVTSVGTSRNGRWDAHRVRVAVIDARHRAVVAYVVQRVRRDETVVCKSPNGRLDVERVSASKSHELRVARHPVIGSALICHEKKTRKDMYCSRQNRSIRGVLKYYTVQLQCTVGLRMLGVA